MAIAANYVKHPEAMQFQRELWSKSKRDCILMRLAGLVMRGGPVPAWVTAAKQRARDLAHAIERCCRDWIHEATTLAQPQRTGFAGHLASWNATVSADKLAKAQAVVHRAWPGVTRPDR